jgi:hypothetical protein
VSACQPSTVSVLRSIDFLQASDPVAGMSRPGTPAEAGGVLDKVTLVQLGAAIAAVYVHDA